MWADVFRLINLSARDKGRVKWHTQELEDTGSVVNQHTSLFSSPPATTLHQLSSTCRQIRRGSLSTCLDDVPVLQPPSDHVAQKGVLTTNVSYHTHIHSTPASSRVVPFPPRIYFTFLNLARNIITQPVLSVSILNSLSAIPANVTFRR